MKRSRLTVAIDENLMAEALKYADLKSKSAAVDEALRLLVRIRRQEAFRELRGKVEWDGEDNEQHGSIM